MTNRGDPPGYSAHAHDRTERTVAFALCSIAVFLVSAFMAVGLASPDSFLHGEVFRTAWSLGFGMASLLLSVGGALAATGRLVKRRRDVYPVLTFSAVMLSGLWLLATFTIATSS